MKQNYIDGQWVGGKAATPNINPSNSDEVIDHYALAGQAEAEQAVDAAGRAFQSWRFSNPQTRHDCLKAIGDGIMTRREEIAQMLAREEGKILREALGETERAARIFYFFAGEALRLSGELLPSVPVSYTHLTLPTTLPTIYSV